MINLRNTVLAMTMGLFAIGAPAHAQFLQDSDSAVVAEELFGSAAVKVEFNEFDATMQAAPFVPKAKLIWSAGDLLEDTEFSVTFTLSRATFAEPVSNADFMWGEWGRDSTAEPPNSVRVFTVDNDEVTIERDGGGKGDNSVTFKVTIKTGQGSTGNLNPVYDMTDMTWSADTTRKIVFLVPDLNVSGLSAPSTFSPNGTDATVTATITQTKSGGTEIVEAITAGNKCGDDVLNMSPTVTVGCPVVEAAAVITSIANTAGGGLISLKPEDERSVLVFASGTAVTPQRTALATVQVMVADGFGGARDQDGDVIDGFTGDLSGSLAIRVSSDSFNEGDVVYIDTNSNRLVDGREAFDMDEGVASDTVSLDDARKVVYYVPSGDAPLTHRTTFTTAANTEFADTEARQRTARAAVAELKLHGIKDGVAQAYAIAPVGHSDITNVRVTCESPAMAGCNVFLDCKDQAGMNTFGEAGTKVGPGETVTWQQDGIQAALGLDAPWEGRLACDVLSSAAISVQVLTRAVGVLVNNTPISAGGR